MISTAEPCAAAEPCRPRPTTSGRQRSAGSVLERLAALAGRLAFGRQGLSDRPNGDRARDHHHAHLGHVPCQIVPERTPERGLAEELAMAAGRQNHSSRKWSVRFFSPGWTPQLYSPVTKTKPSAALIFWPAPQAPRALGPSDTPCTCGRASEVDRLGVDQFGVVASAGSRSTTIRQGGYPSGQTIGAVEDEIDCSSVYSSGRAFWSVRFVGLREPQMMMEERVTSATACRPVR